MGRIIDKGRHHRIDTDQNAAMRRMVGDAMGPN